MNSKETGNHWYRASTPGQQRGDALGVGPKLRPKTEGEQITSKHVFYEFDPGKHVFFELDPRYAETANAIDAAIIAAEERGRSQRQADVDSLCRKAKDLRRQADAMSEAAMNLAAKASYLHDSRSYWRCCAIVGTIAGSVFGFLWGTLL